jgi:hypothetical protein
MRSPCAAASIFPNPTDKGISREQVYEEFLRLHLPSSCNVLFGGFLFNFEGQESKQIDLIITADTCPQYNFHNRSGGGKSFACIEGALGIASIKSYLDSKELVDALDNLASLPEKRPLGNRASPLINIPDYDDWPFKIIYASDGMSLESTTEALDKYYHANHHVPRTSRPNLIHVAGKYFICRAQPNASEATGGPSASPVLYRAKLDPNDELSLALAVHGIQKAAVVAKHILFGYDDILTHLKS